MIFLKSPLQGNFVFTNGLVADFSRGYYETQDEGEIAQLKAVYQEADAKPETKPPAEKPLGKTGLQSSATVAAIAK